MHGILIKHMRYHSQQIGIVTNSVMFLVMQSGLSSGQQNGADELWTCIQTYIIQYNCVARIITLYLLRQLNKTEQACQNCYTDLTCPPCFLLSSEITHHFQSLLSGVSLFVHTSFTLYDFNSMLSSFIFLHTCSLMVFHLFLCVAICY